jgi:hypothetical protein
MIFVGTTVKKNNEDPDRKNEGPRSDAFEALTDQFLLSYLSPDLLEITHRFTNPQSAIFITALHSIPRAGLFSLVRVVYNNPALLLSSISTKQRLMKIFIF